ncbi:MAG: ribose-phosphate diphosphokinase [Clostridiaceae bacterium]|nr:ribose-phosphate diphosphokinase [Clostridiaceae bacterium]
MSNLAFPADQSVKNLFGDEPVLDSNGPIGLITEQLDPALAERINHQLGLRRQEAAKLNPGLLDIPGYVRGEYRIKVDLSRFSSGEGKAQIIDSIRGHDLFILTDVLNYGAYYSRYGVDVSMAPDEHFLDLVRLILSSRDSAARIHVIMPFLFEGRRFRRSTRESLDCGAMLRYLFSLGIDNFITFDAHDSRVANAVPNSNFESFPTSYQSIRTILETIPGLKIDGDSLMIVSPNEVSINRCIFFASAMKVPLGIFYMRRDFQYVGDELRQVTTRTYLGDSVEGKDIIIVADMLDSGRDLVASASELKSRGANRIICSVSYTQFTEGIDNIRQAWESGIIERVFSADMSYRPPEVLSSPWYTDIPMADDLALLISALNHDASLSRLLAPAARIDALLKQGGYRSLREDGADDIEDGQLSFSDFAGR